IRFAQSGLGLSNEILTRLECHTGATDTPDWTMLAATACLCSKFPLSSIAVFEDLKIMPRSFPHADVDGGLRKFDAAARSRSFATRSASDRLLRRSYSVW